MTLRDLILSDPANAAKTDADHEGHRLLGHELWHRLGGHHH